MRCDFDSHVNPTQERNKLQQIRTMLQTKQPSLPMQSEQCKCFRKRREYAGDTQVMVGRKVSVVVSTRIVREELVERMTRNMLAAATSTSAYVPAATIEGSSNKKRERITRLIGRIGSYHGEWNMGIMLQVVGLDGLGMNRGGGDTNAMLGTYCM